MKKKSKDEVIPQTYNQLTIDFYRDVFPVLFTVGIAVVITQFAMKPEGGIILLIETFKLPPEAATLLYSMFMPIAVATVIARFVTIVINFAFVPIILIVVILLLSPLLLIASFFKARNLFLFFTNKME